MLQKVLTRKRIVQLLPFLAACIFLLIVIKDRHGDDYSRPYSLTVGAFNTECDIIIWNEDATHCEQAARTVFRELTAIHNCLNRHDAGSEVSAFNAAAVGKPFACSRHFGAILRKSLEMYAATEGTFNVAVTPLIDLWKRASDNGIPPSSAEIAEALDKCRLETLDAVFGHDGTIESVTKTIDGMALDFGGIAKGYALDVAKAILDEAGIRCYLLNFGGNIYCSATPPPGRDHFTIGLRSPDGSNSVSDTRPLLDCFISTSGNYERGTKTPHIIDTKTGRPCKTLKSVTAITSTGCASDAFSTAVFIGGEPLAKRLSAATQGTSFIIE